MRGVIKEAGNRDRTGTMSKLLHPPLMRGVIKEAGNRDRTGALSWVYRPSYSDGFLLLVVIRSHTDTNPMRYNGHLMA